MCVSPPAEPESDPAASLIRTICRLRAGPGPELKDQGFRNGILYLEPPGRFLPAQPCNLLPSIHALEIRGYADSGQLLIF